MKWIHRSSVLIETFLLSRGIRNPWNETRYRTWLGFAAIRIALDPIPIHDRHRSFSMRCFTLLAIPTCTENTRTQREAWSNYMRVGHAMIRPHLGALGLLGTWESCINSLRFEPKSFVVGESVATRCVRGKLGCARFKIILDNFSRGGWKSSRGWRISWVVAVACNGSFHQRR